jgi:pimeloyl-ACP methyl ester carboxylesterase
VEAAKAGPRAFAADLAAAASWSAGRRELRAVERPVALVNGLGSAAVRQESTRALAELLPGARVVDVESGHFAHLERPDDVAAAIRARV